MASVGDVELFIVEVVVPSLVPTPPLAFALFLASYPGSVQHGRGCSLIKKVQGRASLTSQSCRVLTHRQDASEARKIMGIIKKYCLDNEPDQAVKQAEAAEKAIDGVRNELSCTTRVFRTVKALFKFRESVSKSAMCVIHG